MALDPNKLTRKTQEAIGASQGLARERNHSQVTPEHLLAALVGQSEGVVLPVLERVGVAPKAVKDAVDAALAKQPQVYGSTAQAPQVSQDAYRLLEAADAERVEAMEQELRRLRHEAAAAMERARRELRRDLVPVSRRRTG